MQSLAASRLVIWQCVPFVGEGVPRATRVRSVVFLFAREKPGRADERIGLLPRCVSSRGGQLFAQQKGQRLPVFQAVCPSRLSRRLQSFDPSVRSRCYSGLMIRGRVSRRGRSRIRGSALPAMASEAAVRGSHAAPPTRSSPPTMLKVATSMIPRPATSKRAIVPIKITKIPKAVRLIPCDVIAPPPHS